MAKGFDYQITTVWSGATKGNTTDKSSNYSREFTVKCEGRPDLTGSADTPFKGDPNAYNPELLLLSALSSCHMLSYLYLCAVKNIHIISYTDNATGKLEIAGTKGFFTEALMSPTVVISADSDLELAKQLHEEAHEKCFIANSVNFSVNVMPVIKKV